jgi:methylenetetrahydrofolate reductase (NADPH)
MLYGPCGGVQADGSCELGDRPCPFVGAPLVTWPQPPASAVTAPAGSLLATLARRPVVITDLRVRPLDLFSVTQVAHRLAGTCDAVLIGEHQLRPDLPPTVMARAAADAGTRPWITLTCRDRNRVVLESEMAGLAAIGVEGVHCVTGDARAPTVRTDATQVFDLDSFRLAALARRAGLGVSVAATPAAPPAEIRPARIAEKQRAGAQLCFVNHAGGPARVASFVDAARRLGATLPFIPCVPVFTDAASVAVLSQFPGLVLDSDHVARVINTADPIAAGVEAAVEEARRMLAIDGVAGVNLSGAATAGTEMESAEIMAAIGSRLMSP